MFLHGGLLHIALNMYAFWQLCPTLERALGSARFSAIYFGAGLAGSLASLLFEPASLGASGAICGIMATYLRFERVESAFGARSVRLFREGLRASDDVRGVARPGRGALVRGLELDPAASRRTPVVGQEHLRIEAHHDRGEA